MKTIQILGPSYSGSTVLGYALNTVEGYLFGSELRRILPDARGKTENRPGCDFCGEACYYWNDSLYSKLDMEGAKTLTDLYRAFHSMHPDVEALIDSSKTLGSTKNTQADFRILAVKHPIRLLASSIYNDRKKLDINVDNFELFRNFLEANTPRISKIVDLKLSIMIKTYQRYFEAFKELHLFQNDRAHLEDFLEFRKLEKSLGLGSHAIRATDFSQTPCHSVGGNRAPLWISREAQSKPMSKQPRALYYTVQSKSLGDWRLDNKYEVVLPERLIEEIYKKDIYREACTLLSYEAEKL